MKPQVEIDFINFKKFLGTKDPNEVIGSRGSPENCPLKTYLVTLNPSVKHVVNQYVIFKEDGEEFNQGLPYWASSFVRRIDNIPTDQLIKDNEDTPWHYGVTVAQALQALEGIWFIQHS